MIERFKEASSLRCETAVTRPRELGTHSEDSSPFLVTVTAQEARQFPRPSTGPYETGMLFDCITRWRES